MGVTFTVMGDPTMRRAALRPHRFRIFFLAFGIFLVFGCAFALTKLLAESQSYARSTQPNEHEGRGHETVILVTATSRIDKGTKLSSTQLREISWPRDQVPQGALRNVDEGVNMYVTAPLEENQPILRSSISPSRPMSGIQDLLPPGSRAVTIPVNQTSSIEGWATPGAHVDVLLTYLDRNETVSKTRVIVENAVVLSYGGNAKVSDHSDEAPNMDVSTVTLGIPFSESLKITTAMDLGRISLVLRNSNDVSSQGGGVFSADEWDRKVAPPAPRPAPVARGYARAVGHDGRDKQFVLGDDNRWKDNQSEEFF